MPICHLPIDFYVLVTDRCRCASYRCCCVSVTDVSVTDVAVCLSCRCWRVSVTDVVVSVTDVDLSVTDVDASVTGVSVTDVDASVTGVSVTDVDLSVTDVDLSVTDVDLSVTDVDASVTGVSDTGMSVTNVSVTDAAVSVTDVSVTDVSVTDVSVTDVSVTDVSVTDASATDVSVTDVAVCRSYRDSGRSRCRDSCRGEAALCRPCCRHYSCCRQSRSVGAAPPPARPELQGRTEMHGHWTGSMRRNDENHQMRNVGKCRYLSYIGRRWGNSGRWENVGSVRVVMVKSSKSAVHMADWLSYETIWSCKLWENDRSIADGGLQGSGPPHFWKPPGRPPQKCWYFSIFFLETYTIFASSNIFKIKWSKSEEKHNFGGRRVWVPMNPTPPPQSKFRGDAPGKGCQKQPDITHLTCAPLEYFYRTRVVYFEPPLISETTGQILKIQAAFESPGNIVEGKTNFNDLWVTSDVTGQVKVGIFDFFGLGAIGEQNFDVKLKQSQRIGMDIVSLTFVSIISCSLWP